MAHPAPQKDMAPLEADACNICGQGVEFGLNLGDECLGQIFIGIEAEDPVAGEGEVVEGPVEAQLSWTA